MISQLKTTKKLIPNYLNIIHLRPANLIIEDVAISNDLYLQLTENDVLSAVRSFPIGSGGPNGIRPQHIIDLLGSTDIKPTLLTDITALVKHLLQGHCPTEVVLFLFGGSLTAITKKLAAYVLSLLDTTGGGLQPNVQIRLLQPNC